MARISKEGIPVLPMMSYQVAHAFYGAYLAHLIKVVSTRLLLHKSTPFLFVINSTLQVATLKLGIACPSSNFPSIHLSV